MVLGATVAIGAVRGGLCLSGAGCVSWGERGIVTTPLEQIEIRAP